MTIEVDIKAFRQALGCFTTGVTIITACAPDGTTVGVTASSFNSLSIDPPLILWSCMKHARSCAVFESSTHFAVNVLASDQVELSNHFARQQENKFASVDWQPGIGGAPIFPNCAGRFECETFDRVDGGDHWIFIGRVISFDDFGRPPLCFHRGSYAMLFDHPGSYPRCPEDALETGHGSRMGNHAFFLMLRAIRSYQDRYQPKLEALGLTVVEARVLLVLTDLPDISAEELIAHLHAPVTEAEIALQSLADRGMVASNEHGYVLTHSGRAKAEECWNLAGAHAEETFKDFDHAQLDGFTDMLRHLIDQ